MFLRDIERKLGTHGGDMAGNMVKSITQDAAVTASGVLTSVFITFTWQVRD